MANVDYHEQRRIKHDKKRGGGQEKKAKPRETRRRSPTTFDGLPFVFIFFLRHDSRRSFSTLHRSGEVKCNVIALQCWLNYSLYHRTVWAISYRLEKEGTIKSVNIYQF